jgi:type II secretion system protein J
MGKRLFIRIIAPIDNSLGVTLLEMILAVALSAFLLLIAYSTYFGVNQAIEVASEEQELLETGRILVELLKHDLRGVVSSSKYPLKSEMVDLGEESASNIEFVTTSSINKGLLGMSRVGYALVRTEEGDMVFIRMEAKDLKADLKTEGTVFEVSRIITKFELGFYDGTTWIDSWGESNEGKLPRQVKITIDMKDGKGRMKTFVAEEALLSAT